MTINLDTEPYKLSCRLPYSFTISGINGKTVEVQILINGQAVYETTLAANKQAEASFYDLRSLVHDHLEAALQTIALLDVKARDNNDTVTLRDPIEVLFAKIDAPCEDDDEFLASSFLTTRSFYMVPRTSSVNLRYVLTPQERATPRLSCVFQQGRNGTTTYTFDLDPVENTTYHMGVYSLFLSHDDIRSMAGSRAHTTFEWLLSVTITLGTRTFSIFFTDEEPPRIFYFKNAYNVEESAYIFGTAKMKSVFTNKQASVSGVTSFYDRSKEVTWEVETSALVPEEARWLNQLFDSPSAYVHVGNALMEYVLFDGVTSEISDADNDTVRLKFSYRYESGLEYSPEHPSGTRIFTQEYTRQFS